VQLHASVSIERQAVAVDLDRATGDGDVPLNKGEVDIQGFRIACNRSF